MTGRQDDDIRTLYDVLLEAMLAVYMSLLIYGFTVYDANILYRLVGHPFSVDMWHRLFGGFTVVAHTTGKVNIS
jgi:hypothetical protein